jgi:hypothetical protein
MDLSQTVRLFFKVLYRSILGGISKTLHGAGADNRISLTDHIWVQIPKSELTLWSVGAGGSEIVDNKDISVEEARDIFESIKRACELNDVVNIQIKELAWTTDARTRSNPDEIILAIETPLARTRALAKRSDILIAAAKFNARYGPM